VPSSTRIKANALKLTIATVDYWADLSMVELSSELSSADTTTYYDSSVGGRVDWFLTVSGIQSTATASFWRAMWTAAGTEVAFLYAPHGNATASSTQPHFTGTVRVPAAGSFMLGGQSSPDGTYSFDGVRMDIVGDVTMVVS
jgi:hypothetical protein